MECALAFGSRFELVRVLAHGAMGIVHEAFDRQRNARVASSTAAVKAVTRAGGSVVLSAWKSAWNCANSLPITGLSPCKR